MKHNNKETYCLTFDIHTHTIFSHGNHGKGTIEENVKAAAEKGLKAIGISDHGPGHISYGILRKNFPVMRAEVERLKPLYPQIKIYLGVEANIINVSGHLDVTAEEVKQLDYVLAGYHYGVFGEQPLKAILTHGNNFLYNKLGKASAAQKRFNTEMTVKALYENDIKILTHPGDKGAFDIDELAKACADTDTWMEISTWHKCLTVEDIKTAAKYDVKFIISSDAHTPDRIGDCAGGIKRAKEAGLDLGRIVNLQRAED